ncbi:MAG: ParB/RepB/Spo0J family partition protein [Brevinema sp.]
MSDNRFSSRKGSLGKGLSALVEEQVLETVSGDIKGSVHTISVDKVIPSRNQPRKSFDPADLSELANSITRHGIIQPLVVSDLGNGQYELIAGERRLRASKLAGLTEVPVIFREFPEKDRLAIALIENIQRSDLNAVEIAEAYKEIMDRLGATQEDISSLVGKSRAAVANTLRILKLPPHVRDMISSGKLSEGHGRALLGLEDFSHLNEVLETIITNEYSVRHTEDAVRDYNLKNKDSSPKKTKTPPDQDPKVKVLEDKLVRDLGLKVEVHGSLEKGVLKISYYTTDDLEAFIRKISMR